MSAILFIFFFYNLVFVEIPIEKTTKNCHYKYIICFINLGAFFYLYAAL